MSIEATLERITALRQTLADPVSLIAASTARTGGTAAPIEAGLASAPAAAGSTGAESSFATALRMAASSPIASTALAPSTLASTTLAPSTLVPATLAPTSGVASPAGARIVALAESQLGQAEQPPGSNESPAIAEYRTATAGAMPGAPWCAYFASWAAARAGEPIGAGGQGAGSASAVWSWAQSSGRAVPNGPGVVPKAGDLIVFGDEHVGIVRGVLPDGSIQTIEGNYENKVAANVRGPSEATGYVSMS
jgi:hypothetical protein